MSVLMKALEKAAQDRDKTPNASNGLGDELSLEPVETKPAEKAVPREPVASARSNSSAPRSAAQMSAATVLSAREPMRPNVLAWLRAHPLYLFGAGAGLFLLAYGAYVYVQIANPGWLTPSPPPMATAPKPAPATPGPPAVSPTPPVAATSATGDASSTTLPELQSVFGGTAASAAQTPAAEPIKPSASPSPPRAPSIAAAPPPLAASVPLSRPIAAAPAAALSRDRIAINRGDSAAARINPAVNDAYAALQAGQFDAAQRLYNDVLRSEPHNVDALLGLAAIAQRANRPEEAHRHFMAILNVEPRHALAQAGLLASMARAEPTAAESRLKQLIAREPSAPLYFNLGNLYADQGLWPQAQQAFFQAHDLDSKNPEYAYNLAVGLEHIHQPKLALGYYRKALELVSVRGAANFDVPKLQERITRLSARFD